MDLIKKIVMLFRRNSIILSMTNYPARKNRINLNWAAICNESKDGIFFEKADSFKQNLGDWLAIPIFDFMLKYYDLNPDKRTSQTIHLYTIGSIIMMGFQDACIWGSGILLGEPEGTIWKRSKYRKLDIRCVRGPETKRRLEENGYDVNSCVYGDPGVLMPLIYKPNISRELEREYSVVLHMNKKEESVCNQIDILTDDWKKTIDEIANSKLIISSSLHGIIIAEAYGIPAILYNSVEYDDFFKYRDYYYSTGRYEFPVCNSIEEALNTTPAPLPDIKPLQNNLINSFPVDLWY